MSQAYINIYQSARISKGITQEKAAELVTVSVESIRAYESGSRIPPDEVVVRMIEVYDAQFLAIQHLRTKSEIARSILPDFEQKELPEAILRILKEVGDFVKRRDELIEIGSDGVISPDERVQFDEIMKELDDIVQAYMVIKFAK